MEKKLKNAKYFMKDYTISNLKKLGFRYDAKSSTNDYRCYTFNFVVDEYNDKPTLICKLRTYLDNGETTVDLYNSDNTIFSAWYQQDNKSYTYQQEYLKKIKEIISKQISLFGIESTKE